MRLGAFAFDSSLIAWALAVALKLVAPVGALLGLVLLVLRIVCAAQEYIINRRRLRGS